MPQVLKPEIRERILEAARVTFAARGFAVASMADIAEHAGVGAASLYRYYGSKEELFDSAIPASLARELDALLARRVSALGAALARSDDDASEDVLRFWTTHRLATVVLLDRAAGTAHAGFAQRFVDRLLALSIEQLRAAYPDARVDAATRFVLRRVFEGTRITLAALLEAHESEAAMREAIEVFWTYQLAGLRAISERVGRQASARRRARSRER